MSNLLLRTGQLSYFHMNSEEVQKQTENTCDICYNRYDQNERKPLVVCNQKHTICRVCLKAVIRAQKCPFCRGIVAADSLTVNHQMYNECGPHKIEANIRAQISQSSVRSSYLSLYLISQESSLFDQQQILIEEIQPALMHQSVENQMHVNYQLLELQQAIRLHRQHDTRCKTHGYCLVLISILFLIDLILAISERRNQCGLQPLLQLGPNFMFWMELIVIMNFLLIIFIIFSLIGSIRMINSRIFYYCRQAYLIGFLFKMGISTIIETLFFFDSLTNCNGVLFVYGLISLIFHSLFVVGGLITLINRI